MTPKERAAMQQAFEALELHLNGCGVAIATRIAYDSLREALAEPELNLNCKSVQKRLATVWGYVKAEQAEQEPFDMNDHPPHRLCECRKCMEYFTPLPDCDAFAAFGKPIAEQTNTQLMEGYRIGLAEMREKCATVSEQGTGEAVQKTALELLLNERKRIAAAIRAIKFEGDTGFRPVSEMIAEHKQDHKKGAAIEKAKMRKATRAEKIAMSGVYEVPVEQAEQEPVLCVECGQPTMHMGNKCYSCCQKATRGLEDALKAAVPVRTKDMTDDEIEAIMVEQGDLRTTAFARAVIAADREKNK